MENIIVVVRNGAVKFRCPGKVLADGSVRMIQPSGRSIPVVNSSACKALGLDAKVVTKNEAPVSVLAHMGDNGDGLVLYTAAEFVAVENQKHAEKAAKIELAVPGLAEAIRLRDAAYNERERYSRGFERMMADENNDGARPPRAEDMSTSVRLNAHLANHPRAALYLEAKSQEESTHWADNTGKGAAGKKAMEILASGGSIEDATAALAVRRRDFVD